ncbi:hypothetical protein QQX09_04565 [Demequina sp. SYSU T00192]|uniref:Uncharacterized protein n=1 Tax=Demequina litoralis TaxID=3051660 RepID=A0ABT8G7L9_9MICO|nr:hypothetical protein [Demequina sp. SYSU T00192]MDN4475130.1 hypothetical protein [Demequina sp. SYSU T00192]
MIRLEEDGLAPVLRYDIPEPTSYSGVNLIELAVAASSFKPELSAVEHGDGTSGALGHVDALRKRLRGIGGGGLAGRPGAGLRVDVDRGRTPPEPVPPADDFPDDILEALAGRLSAGERLVVSTNVNGTPTVSTAPVPPAPRPGLYLVETLRLSTYLGSYGAGRVINTMTLLPGESTRISVSTFRESEEKRSRSSSVLDSVTDEAATDLSQSIQSEQSNQSAFAESTEYYADVSGKASWGWGSAEAKAGVKGSTNAARQEATKNLSNATEKHASKASAKREVAVDTAYEATSKSGEQTSIEREISNVNVSRTLNFVFRQMNQEFVTVTHLTDLRVAYFDGFHESRREVPLADLEALLDDVIVDADRQAVRQMILDELDEVLDWQGRAVSVVEEVPVPGSAATIRRFKERTEEVPIGGHDDAPRQDVRGVVLGVDTNVMRTDGVIVESLLGEGVALDGYAAELQSIEVARRRAEADLLAARAARAALVNEIIAQGDATRAEVAKAVSSADDEDHP